MRIKMAMLLASLGVGGGLLLPGVARADTVTCYPSCPPPVIHVTPGGPSPAPAVSTQATAVTSQAPAEPPGDGGLPFTGADIAGLSLVGAAAIGAGAFLVYRSRRPTSVEGS